jgi:metal-dependent hydrolase (beta-lactamase superfamily II)
MLLDYGYTPEVLLKNMQLLALDPAKLNALIVSHGHFDHFGGLIDSGAASSAGHDSGAHVRGPAATSGRVSLNRSILRSLVHLT